MALHRRFHRSRAKRDFTPLACEVDPPAILRSSKAQAGGARVNTIRNQVHLVRDKIAASMMERNKMDAENWHK